MLRPRPGSTAARIVQLQDRPKQAHSVNGERPSKVVRSVATQTMELVDIGLQTEVVPESKDIAVLNVSATESVEVISDKEEVDAELGAGITPRECGC
ncbi:hypothetical protein PF002_g28141 [Phytophthora fragariae]|uniref:Uncharacterized protein n=2 Tax=Phytophthora fragariae TaxID=53985 RepID=A0A6A3QLG6_9STRA|nr:hypothetical protein PF009_g26843 [Phytophthora fragariae]KAE9070050.1 hypothetical protein PF007_g27081 [Phytophthora fragariae]KAE9077607.1 hypothetical protein PF006_g27888 [Phytophthora fragariae]KAE9178183.1 hypothetical protein PF002_g28141 [Phytophthora fragariae]